MARVREAAEWSDKAANHMPVAANITGSSLPTPATATRRSLCGFRGPHRPRKHTLLPKTTKPDDRRQCLNERVIIAKKGDTVVRILRDLGATPEDISAIAGAWRPRPRWRLKEGQKLRILMSPIRGGQRLQPIRVIVASDFGIDAVVALSDTGKYVSVDVKTSTPKSPKMPRTTTKTTLRRAALPKRLRDCAAQPDTPPHHRRSDPHLLLRRRFPAQSAAGRFLRSALRRRGGNAGRR